jgi:hypothetical protein
MTQLIFGKFHKILNNHLEVVMMELEKYHVGTVKSRIRATNPEWTAKYKKNQSGPDNRETDIKFTARVDKHYIHLTFPHESPLVD